MLEESKVILSSGKENIFAYADFFEKEVDIKIFCEKFRARQVNVEGYDAKMRFWQKVIKQYCAFKGEPFFCLEELKSAFTYNEKTPECLETVIETMLQTKRIRKFDDFQQDPLNTWTGWARNSVLHLLGKPLQKIKTAIGLFNPKTYSLIEKHVHLECMQDLCRQLETKILQENCGKLLFYEEFKTLVKNADINMTDTSLKLCLKVFCCTNSIYIDYDNQQQDKIHVIKIPKKGSMGDELCITVVDRAEIELRNMKILLLEKLNNIEKELNSYEENAKLYLKQQKREMAKTYLRKKKILQVTYEKRHVDLENIDQILLSMDESKTNSCLVNTFKLAKGALQNIHSANNLNYENVDDVIADLRETLDTHREIQDKICSNELNNEDINNIDLENELNDLLLDESKQEVKGQEKETTAAAAVLEKVVIEDKELLNMFHNLDVKNDKKLVETA